MKGPHKLLMIRGETARNRRYKTVSEFLIMHDCAATCRATHDVQFRAGLMQTPIIEGLKIAQRKRCRCPGIKTQDCLTLACRFKQGFVDRHINAARRGRIENQSDVHFNTGCRAACTSLGRLIIVE